MTVSRRDFLKLAAAGLTVTAAEASGLGILAQSRARAQDVKTLRVAWGTAPVQLDPIAISSDAEVSFVNAVYDYLVDTNEVSEVLPRLATAWQTSEDGLTYTFTIAEGVRFHNGDALTLDDVVWTFDRLRNTPDTPTADLYSNIVSVAAGEGNTVVFTLTRPDPDFLYSLSDYHAVVLQKDAADLGTVFNGTGPYTLAEYLAEDRAVFSANADYFGGAPTNALQFLYFADNEAAANALRGGTVDVLLRIDSATFLALATEGAYKTYDVATNQHDVLRLRADTGPGADVRVRQAFRLATDRQAIYDRLQFGYGAIGRDTPVGPRYGLLYTEATPLPARDAAAAKALLTEAGFADGLNMTLYTVNDAARLGLAQALAAQWAEAGINVTIEPQEEGVYYADDGWLGVELGITPWGDRPSPQFYFDVSLKTGAKWNESHFSDAELDTLIDEASSTTDRTLRAEKFHEMQRILIERGPLVISYFTAQFAAAAQGIDNLSLQPFPGRTRFNQVTVA
jgi:peptide/nickel transport system substrate-binding protein